MLEQFNRLDHLLQTETGVNKNCQIRVFLTLRKTLFLWNVKMKKKPSLTFAVVGAGMVGTAIGFLLQKSGHDVAAVADLSAAHLKRAASYIRAPGFHHPARAAAHADCILITTPDGRIASACAQIVSGSDVKGKKVFHMSGAGGLDLLATAARAGALTASIHPLQSFSSIDGAIASIPGSYFGVTAAAGAKKMAAGIVRDLQGIPIPVSAGQKPLYHAAACIASNYLVSLLSVVESIYKSIGFSEQDARRAYLPLVYGSLKNIENQGCPNALTGPIARGDSGTVQKHIDALARHLPDFASIYAHMGAIAVKLAREKGTLSAAQAKEILRMLKGE